jgi:hypothetical protein
MCDRHGSSIGSLFKPLFAQMVDAVPAEIAAPRQARRRLKLWELEEKHHCPVVGTCLKLEDIKKVARKGGFDGGEFDEYRLHVEAVSISCSRNSVSESMHKLLDRKYDLYLRRFDKARTADEVVALWNQHLEQGEVAGPMWAALTHKAGTAESRKKVYADVHMLSHQVGAGQAADLRRLEWLEREHASLREVARHGQLRHARELAERQDRICQLEREAAETWQRAQEASPLRERLEALESGLAMTGMARRLMALTDESARLRERNVQLEARLTELEAQKSQLAESFELAARERDAMEQLWLSETGTTLAEAKPETGCGGACGTCPSRLHGRCVLCVGGRTPLLPQYRQLAERLGVRLIHHDGGKEEALSRLPAMLASSDAVICPTDCVGHLAYYQLKQHCKQAGKPCVLVKSSGVAVFAAALTRLADGRADIQSQT